MGEKGVVHTSNELGTTAELLGTHTIGVDELSNACDILSISRFRLWMPGTFFTALAAYHLRRYYRRCTQITAGPMGWPGSGSDGVFNFMVSGVSQSGKVIP